MGALTGTLTTGWGTTVGYLLASLDLFDQLAHILQYITGIAPFISVDTSGLRFPQIHLERVAGTWCERKWD